MKELVLCMILVATGALAICDKPLPGKPRCPSQKKWCFTQWFDRDDPTGKGDYETIDKLRCKYPNVICENPRSIQAQTLTGVDASATGQVFESFDTNTGFVCVNNQQGKKKKCLDYRVRFECPCPC